MRKRKATQVTNRDRVLEFLQSIAPTDASNSDIVARTGIKPHQQVFMITQDLMHAGWIKGRQAGREWKFWRDVAEQGVRIKPRIMLIRLTPNHTIY